MEEVIVVKNLSFAYAGNEVVSNVSFSVEKGDYIALIGHNGSGKTTLIKLLLGILRPTGGEVFIFGKRLENFDQWEKVGYLPQNIGLFNPLFPATVREIVSLGLLARKGFPKRLTSKDYQAVQKSLMQMDIVSLGDKLIGELSGGQLQRTFLARAIVNQPEILILDEPVSSVDPETREEFFSYASFLNKKNKTTIIIITHDIGHSVKYTNKLLFLDKRLIFYGDYKSFCISKEMAKHFDPELLHIICHQH